MGTAIPQKIGRHVHAKARPDEITPAEPVSSGIDYLHLVEQQHTAELAERVQYSQLRDEPVPDGHVRGQLPLPDTNPTDESEVSP
jgi:putative transposase